MLWLSETLVNEFRAGNIKDINLCVDSEISPTDEEIIYYDKNNVEIPADWLKLAPVNIMRRKIEEGALICHDDGSLEVKKSI